MNDLLFLRRAPSWLNVSEYGVSTALGIAHGITDATTAFLLTSLAWAELSWSSLSLILLYDVIAFALQPLFGAVVDRLKQHRSATALGVLLAGLSLLLMNQSALAAVVVTAIGSALFHVGGGALTLRHEHHRATHCGIFTAPGVVGLGIGAALAMSHLPVTWLLLGLCLLFALVILFLPTPSKELDAAAQDTASDTASARAAIESEWFIILCFILFAIALRSSVWVAYRAASSGDLDFFLKLSCAAGIGKLAGGFLSEKIGRRRYIALAFGLSALLLSFFDDAVIATLAGIALLQSTTPIALAAVGDMFRRRFPEFQATAAGLTLGLAIAIGGIPWVFGWTMHLTATVLASAIIFYVSLQLFHQTSTQIQTTER